MITRSDGKPKTQSRSQVVGTRRLLAFFEKLKPCLVGIEACTSSHYWGRELVERGHVVRLLPNDPSLPAPIYASLEAEGPDEFTLLWSHRQAE